MKDKLHDEIKLAGLEALVPEELEKHLILNSNRLRTFEDALLELVTYVEAKIGLRIRDSKPSDTGSRGHSDPMDVDAVNSLSSGKGTGSSKTGLSGLENSKPETSLETHESKNCQSHDGWSPNEWNNGMMTGVRLDDTKVGNKRMTLPQAYFHLEVWILVPREVRSGSH